MAEVLAVEGLDELLRAFRKADGDLDRELKRELREVGEIVRDDERDYLSGIGASRKSVSGIRTQLRFTSAAVQQRYGTITGVRGDWGARIMSSLARARSKKWPETERRLEQMLDRIGRQAGF